MSDNNKLVPTTGKLSPLKVGMSARLQQAKTTGGLASDLFDYTKYPNRIVLCIDDSGSMSVSMLPERGIGDPIPGHIGDNSRMNLCRQACEEFINVCDSRDTALGMYTISTGKQFKLSLAYPMLLAEVRNLHDSGGTPTIETLDKIQKNENVTRVVVISDGESGALAWEDFDNKGSKFSQNAQRVMDVYKEKKIIIDTVFIGEPNSNGEREMKLIAEYTGGLFLVFKSGESFRTKFKYLAPAFRGMLTSGQVKV